MLVEHTTHTHTSINYIGNSRIREGKGGADRAGRGEGPIDGRWWRGGADRGGGDGRGEEMI